MVNHLARPCFNLEQAAFIVGFVQEPVSGLIVSLAQILDERTKNRARRY
jgi:hypothetical protein